MDAALVSAARATSSSGSRIPSQSGTGFGDGNDEQLGVQSLGELDGRAAPRGVTGPADLAG
jgi:hypothetical protein